MSTTPNLSLPLMVQNQSGKEVTHNGALVIIDALLNNGIIDLDINTPPSTPNTGDTYTVGTVPTDEFVNHEGELAFYNNGWRFITPKEGLTLWVNDEDKLYSYNGSSWTSTDYNNSLDDLTDATITTPSQNDLLVHDGIKFVNSKVANDLERIGINTTADANNKLAVASDNVLFNNNGTDVRVKANKALDTNTASHLFQSNWSGRAEFGLIGNDDFTLKVSSDGSNWNNAMVVSKDNGDTNIKQNLTVSGDLSSGTSSEAGVIEVKNSDGVTTGKINSEGDSYINSGNLALGNTVMNSKAILDIQSTTKGVLFPRMSTTERDAIIEPPEGLMIYNTTLSKLQCYDNSIWQSCF